MASRRMLSRDISIAIKVNRLTDAEALLYTWTIPFLDDFGRIEGEPEVIKAQVVPMRSITVAKISAALAKMCDLGLIAWHITCGKLVVEYLKFDEYQTNTHKRTKSKLPSWDSSSTLLTSENFREFLGKSGTRELNLIELNLREKNLRELSSSPLGQDCGKPDCTLGCDNGLLHILGHDYQCPCPLGQANYPGLPLTPSPLKAVPDDN